MCAFLLSTWRHICSTHSWASSISLWCPPSNLGPGTPTTQTMPVGGVHARLPLGLANGRHQWEKSWDGTGHFLGFFHLLDLLLRPSDPPDTSSLEASADPGTLRSPL